MAAERSIVGVWRVNQVVNVGRTLTRQTNPPPGLVIFTRNHYSIVRVTDERPTRDRQARLSAEEAFALWGPFQANAGEYEAYGTSVTIRPSVAKQPVRMAPGAFEVLTFKIQDETLWLGQGETTLKLTRIE